MIAMEESAEKSAQTDENPLASISSRPNVRPRQDVTSSPVKAV